MKSLVLDIETSPLVVKTWGIRDQYVGIEDIVKDWSIISWSAKWLNKSRIYQLDQRDAKDPLKDKKLLEPIWDMLNEADEIITQNGKSFDVKRLNARFAINKMGRPSTYSHFDVYREGKKIFGFTSHKLEYMCNVLDLEYKKEKHSDFPGKTLWDECLAGNLKAWKSMAKYNRVDVLALESLYKEISPYVTDYNRNSFYGELVCACGSRNFTKNGTRPHRGGMYQRLHCKSCGAEHRGEKVS